MNIFKQLLQLLWDLPKPEQSKVEGQGVEFIYLHPLLPVTHIVRYLYYYSSLYLLERMLASSY